MPRGKYTAKQERKAKHIEESYEDKGVSEKEAKSRAWATVNKQDGGGNKKGGSGNKSSKSNKSTSGNKRSSTTKSSTSRKKAAAGRKGGKAKARKAA